ncbi:probable ATP-dependent RNA helicase DHX37 isoform X2 [Dysidea avara]|uniref:probable ATP-dependent RNA helicase DHX37 isoform X2 n=1 Tax=Dysidea avara TaxID=196820 RepID=UPI0033349C1C
MSRRKGFNWKARAGSATRSNGPYEDTNVLELPPKKQKLSEKKPEKILNRNKLSSRQKKHLQKTVERKIKKAKRKEILEQLSSCAIAESELSLLHSTTTIGKAKQTKRQMEHKVELYRQVNSMNGLIIDSSLKSRRRKRGKLIKIEKQLFVPKKDVTSSEDDSGEDSSLEDVSSGDDNVMDLSCNTTDQSTSVPSTTVASNSSTVKDAVDLLSIDSTSMLNHNTLYDCTVMGDGVVLSKDGLDLCQQTVKEIMKPLPVNYVSVHRTPEIQVARLSLPILAEEQAVMEAINGNDIVVLCGETGSGKTTQVPQFLYEAGYHKRTHQCMIGITEPRRVAAIAMSQRVAKELNLSTTEVSYHIRYENNITERTSVKFMTDGVLLKEMEKVESRQYPVSVHFNRKTPNDYVAEAYRKVCKIHRKLTAGNILVFVTGQKDVHLLCKRLQQTFSSSVPLHTITTEIVKCVATSRTDEIDLDSYPSVPDTTAVQESFFQEEEEDNEIMLSSGGSEDEGVSEDEIASGLDAELPLVVKPLYSQLPSDQQAEVFIPPPDGVRLCVVATNVAETSLTIPGVKYVVDTGKVKVRYYDRVTGISTFRVNWTSKASANQRAGRAGRTEAGHCYRLYSSAVFQHQFEEFLLPELSRRPVDDLFLQMKVLNIDKVINFPFPTPPSKEALQSAETLLIQLGALEYTVNKATVLTSLGRTMSQFPVAPRYSKMLCLGSGQKDCLSYIIAIVAGLSVKEIFSNSLYTDHNNVDDKQKNTQLLSQRRTWAGQGENFLLGDLMVILKAIGGCEFAGCSSKFCKTHGLRFKAMKEIRKLRSQLTNSVNANFPDIEEYLDPKMTPPSQIQAKLLRQIVLTGMGDHVARKIHTRNMSPADQRKFKTAYQCMLCESPVYMHPSSVLIRSLPQFVIFQEIVETSKLFMRDITAVIPEWLAVCVPNMCTFSKPLNDPPPSYDDNTGTVKCHIAATFGCYSWPIAPQELPYPDGIDKYKLFGQFFLQGLVCPPLKEFAPLLLVSPVSMTKRWAKLHKCTEVLLAALVNREVCSKSSLMEAWKEDRKFLLGAYSMWIPQSQHQQLITIWPPF